MSVWVCVCLCVQLLRVKFDRWATRWPVVLGEGSQVEALKVKVELVCSSKIYWVSDSCQLSWQMYCLGQFVSQRERTNGQNTQTPSECHWVSLVTQVHLKWKGCCVHLVFFSQSTGLSQLLIFLTRRSPTNFPTLFTSKGIYFSSKQSTRVGLGIHFKVTWFKEVILSRCQAKCSPVTTGHSVLTFPPSQLIAPAGFP